MTFINELTYETLTQIFGSLSVTDLVQVSRVSRRWHEICEPVLYRKPYIIGVGGIPPDIELFLRTLLSPGCERLASHVRVLIVHWLDGPVDLTPERESIMETITAEISRLGVSHSCSPGSQSAHLVLLMHLLPRLKDLTLKYHATDRLNDIMHGICPGPSEPIPLAFHSLTHFYYEAYYLSIGLSPKTLLFLLQLPLMRTLEVKVVNDFHRDIFANVGGTSGVTKLTFLYCTIPPASVALILSVPRALEYFSYKGHYVPGFLDVLLPLRASLTHLYLNFRLTFDAGQIVTLREWPVLQTLRCSPALLLLDNKNGGADGQSLAAVLPVCIRRLELLNFSESPPWTDFDDMVDAMEQLMREKWMVPALEGLVVETGTCVYREKVRFACNAAGVRLEDYCGWW